MSRHLVLDNPDGHPGGKRLLIGAERTEPVLPGESVQSRAAAEPEPVQVNYTRG